MSAVVERNPYQDYTVEFKAETLAKLKANNGNALQTAKEQGIQYSTLQYWIANSDRFDEIRQQKQENLIDKLDKRAHELIDAMPEKIAEASLSQTATALGIVIDKSQILKGLPTSINAEVERQELVVILQSALSAELPSIDVTPDDPAQTESP